MSTRIMPVGKLSHLLKKILGDTALDIQHVGSTSICSISAKPIIDIAVAGQKFFVMEDGDIRTHHIHVVKWNGTDWNNYINFRDYLNANKDKAMMYNDFKQKLAMQFSNDRKSYTAGKKEIIDRLLSEARIWKLES